MASRVADLLLAREFWRAGERKRQSPETAGLVVEKARACEVSNRPRGTDTSHDGRHVLLRRNRSCGSMWMYRAVDGSASKK
jgi:hypothetical protein